APRRGRRRAPCGRGRQSASATRSARPRRWYDGYRKPSWLPIHHLDLLNASWCTRTPSSHNLATSQIANFGLKKGPRNQRLAGPCTHKSGPLNVRFSSNNGAKADIVEGLRSAKSRPAIAICASPATWPQQIEKFPGTTAQAD